MEESHQTGAIVSILTGTLITVIWTFFLPSWDGYQNLNPFLKINLSSINIIGFSLDYCKYSYAEAKKRKLRTLL